MHISVAENRVVLSADTRAYPKDAVLSAAYAFVGRCYVLLDVGEADTLSVSLTGRTALAEDGLRALGGEFGNELLAQTMRQRIVAQHAPLIGQIVGRAVAGARPRPAATPPPAVEPEPAFDLSELEALELDDEPFDDPMGIAMSWEDKYGKERKGGKSLEGGDGEEA